jgi:tyrosine-protein phosphatase YwqE
MFSGLFNRKKNKESAGPPPAAGTAFSYIGADMHSHFIPGIDDGAKTIEDSVTLIKSMVALGYTSIITTPHIMVDYYPNTSKIILDGLETVQHALKEHKIEVKMRAAAEYYIDEHFVKLLETEPLLTIYKNEVLVECSMMYEPPMLTDVLFNMVTSGYRPVLAHPERYLFFHNNLERYTELKDRGCLMQLNTLAITGYYGKSIKSIAEELLARGMYDYLGTDMHHERHAAAITDLAFSKTYDKLVSYPFLNKRLTL